MSDEDTPAPKPGSNRGFMMMAAAVVLTAGAGFGLYATLAGKGNEAQAACTVDESRKQAITEASTGELAAFNTGYPVHDLSGLAFNDANGKPVTLANWKGKTVLFNLWATWCAPCRKEMPALQQLNVDLGGDDFEVVAVSIDLNDPAKPKGFYEKINLDKLGFFHDPTMGVFNDLKARGMALGMPTTVLVGPDGCSLGVLSGPAEWASDDARKLVKAAM